VEGAADLVAWLPTPGSQQVLDSRPAGGSVGGVVSMRNSGYSRRAHISISATGTLIGC
jgi:hypothetical protein